MSRVLALTILAISGCASIDAAAQPQAAPEFSTNTTTKTTPEIQELRDELNNLFMSPSAGNAIWGVLVRSADRNESLFRLNERTLLIPASVQKIITLATAVQALGWDHRFNTKLLTVAPVKDGRLEGDIVVRGSGDPTLGVPNSRDENVFASWAKQLRESGVDEIAGRIVGDDGNWDQGPSGRASGLAEGWAWNDLPFSFAAPVGALQYRENIVEIRLAPGRTVGALALSAVVHPTSGLRLVNRVTTGPPNSELTLRLSRFPGQAVLGLDGSLPLGADALSRMVSVDNPTLFFIQALREALVGYGIDISGEAVDADELGAEDETVRMSEFRVLLSHWSAPLFKMSIDMMKQSRNLPAETLFRMVGMQKGDGSDVANQTAVTEILKGWSISPHLFRISDGSGLSRHNLLTAETLVRVLERIFSDPITYALFEETLPVAADDGTLSRRMRGTVASRNARGKTGSMSGVQTLSGYVDTEDGETLIFAILANNFQVPPSQIRALIDQAVIRLAAFSR